LARELLEWSPKVSLPEGLSRTVAWIKAHPQSWTAPEYAV
jgi:nucleoside-diphosphate-sugar epimerase